MKKARILCVCGSGTVSSAMVSQKLKEQLAEQGVDAEMATASPSTVENTLLGSQFDLIACVSPVYQEYNVPKVNAVGMLTGLSEEQVVADCLKIINAK